MLNQRKDAGLSYAVVQVFENGKPLHISKESAYDNAVATKWGYCEYNGISGWICLSQCSVVVEKTAENKLAAESIEKVELKAECTEDAETAEITALDKDGNAVWTIKDESKGVAQNSKFTDLGVSEGKYYYIADGRLKVLNLCDGSEAWSVRGVKGNSGKIDADTGVFFTAESLSGDIFVYNCYGMKLEEIKNPTDGSLFPVVEEIKDGKVKISYIEPDVNVFLSMEGEEIKVEKE
ncbi:MAG: hypothetical protein HUJ76_08525 [Parasporobacterium sp.]|nr:hypothetical protein [Parasporobacterium sp.]